MPDTDLVKRCQAGESEALAQLFMDYKDRVFRLAYLVTRSQQDAQDVVQETFIRVMRAVGDYDESKGSFETWLYAITVNLARDHLRRQSHFPLPWHFLTEQRAARDSRPEDLSLVKEWQQAIWDAVNSLEERQRITIILHYYLGLSCAEIARMLSCPEGTVHSRLYYARLALEKRLSGEEYGLVWSIA